jgi:hypothetical protein
MMPRPAELPELDGQYPVVVVGADLAGAVVASRLARAGRRVCLLERRVALEPPADAAEGPFDPPDAYWDDARLPAAVRADAGGAIAAGLAAAREMLDGQAAHSARLAEAYLEDAVAHGAEVFAGVDVKSVERAGERWVVKFDLPGAGRERFEAPSLFVLADLLVLAAGAWAQQILAAAAADGLPLSALFAGANGCVMGEDAATGVVDERGQLFASPRGRAVHPGLLVVGSSTLPTALRPAPTLALAALAERSSALIAAGQGWMFATGAPRRVQAARAPAVGLQFTESMRGFFSTRVTEPDYGRGVAHGKDDGSSFVFVLTLIAEDASVLADAPDHPAKSIGTVVAPALSPRPLMVAAGDFNLFVDQPGKPPTRRMRYRMKMLTREGRVYFMDGFKVIRDDPGLDVWPDTTTLYITVHDGADDQAPVLGRGILHIFPDDFKKQLQTLKINHATTTKQKVRAQLGFARVFMGTLFDTYVGADRLLPELRRAGGFARVKLAIAGRTVAALLALGLAWWPWRMAFLRVQPPITAQGPALDLPADVAALGLFPQYLRGLDLRPGKYELERLHYRAGWLDDNIVTDHGGLGAGLYTKPADIRMLTDWPIRRGYMNLARVRDVTSGQVVGLGSQVETATLPPDSLPFPPWHDIKADTTWSIAFGERGLLFLSQKEGGPDIGQAKADAAKAGAPWKGKKRINHTLGPLPGGQGIVHGGTGAFAGVVGVFKEWNSLFEVPAEGPIDGETEWEITLLRAPRLPEAPPAPVGPLAPPPASYGVPAETLTRLPPGRPVRVVVRTLAIELDADLIYRTHGAKAAGAVIPASLGALGEVSLDRVTAFMARLRDERGDVVGQAGALRVDPAGPGGERAAQWTLLFGGEGSIFIALDPAQERSAAPGAEQGFLGGASRGVVIGGSGLYANAAGTLEEVWPAAGGSGVRLHLTLVNDR